jgi:hypothetical protein
MGRTGFPGRSFPDARRGEVLPLDAREFRGAFTRLELAALAGDFFFLMGVLNRDSLRGADGASPLVFWAYKVPPKASIRIVSTMMCFAIPDFLVRAGGE